MSSGSRPSQSNWINPGQMQEILASNAGLTPTGQRARPGRSRGLPYGNRGGGGGVGAYATGRPTPTASFSSATTARAGSGVGNAPMTNWTVGPTTAQPVFKPASPIRARSRSPTRAASTPSTFGPAPTVQAKPPSPPKIRESVLVANGTFPQQNAVNVTLPPGRQLITSNMTPDDPTKPWIPAHLQQKSAFDTILHLSNITGYGLEELTSDGVSIPGVLKTRSVSLHLPSPGPTSAPAPAIPTSAATAPANIQAEVNPSTWISAYANRGSANGFPTTPAQPVAEPARVASYSDMDVDMDGPASNVPPTTEQPRVFHVGTLADSQWANPSPGINPQPTAVSAPNWNSFGNNPTIPPPAFNQQPTAASAQTWNNLSNNAMENVKPTTTATAPLRNAGQSNTTTVNSSDVLTRALAEAKPEKKLATLKDSRWA